MHIILPDLHVILFFISIIIKCLKKIFINYFTISYIIVYGLNIISNILDKIGNSIELIIVKY